MKHLLLVLVLGICTFSLSAQYGPNNAQKKADRVIQKLDQKLNLSASQESNIKEAYMSLAESMPKRTAASAGDRTKFKADFIARIEPMITSGQQADWTKFKTRFLAN